MFTTDQRRSALLPLIWWAAGVGGVFIVAQTSCVIRDVFPIEFATELRFYDSLTGDPLAGLRVSACAVALSPTIEVWPDDRGACLRPLAPTNESGVTWAPTAIIAPDDSARYKEMVAWQLIIQNDDLQVEIVVDNESGNVGSTGLISVTIAGIDEVISLHDEPVITSDGILQVNAYLTDVVLCDVENNRRIQVSSSPFASFVQSVDIFEPIEAYDYDVGDLAPPCMCVPDDGCTQCLWILYSPQYHSEPDLDRTISVRLGQDGTLEKCDDGNEEGS